MGYLICEKCKGYYELREGEHPEDFDRCQCGGKLKYVDKLEQPQKAEKKRPYYINTRKISGVLLGAVVMLVSFYINSPDTTSASFVYNSQISFYIWFAGGIVAALVGGGNIRSGVGNGFYAAALSGLLVIVLYYYLLLGSFTGPTFGDNAALFAGFCLVYLAVPAVFSMVGGLVAALARTAVFKVLRQNKGNLYKL